MSISCASFGVTDCQLWVAVAEELALEVQAMELDDPERVAKAARYTRITATIVDAGCEYVPFED
jgi:hypothetical protein